MESTDIVGMNNIQTFFSDETKWYIIVALAAKSILSGTNGCCFPFPSKKALKAKETFGSISIIRNCTIGKVFPPVLSSGNSVWAYKQTLQWVRSCLFFFFFFKKLYFYVVVQKISLYVRCCNEGLP